MQVVVQATDMYSRVLCGQLGVVVDPFLGMENKYTKGNSPALARDVLTDSVKANLFPGLVKNQSLSIAGPDTPEEAQVPQRPSPFVSRMQPPRRSLSFDDAVGVSAHKHSSHAPSLQEKSKVLGRSIRDHVCCLSDKLQEEAFSLPYSLSREQHALSIRTIKQNSGDRCSTCSLRLHIFF